MYDDATLPALDYVGEPSVGQFPAQVAEVERFLLRFLPFMLRRPELISHYPLLYRAL